MGWQQSMRWVSVSGLSVALFQIIMAGTASAGDLELDKYFSVSEPIIREISNESNNSWVPPTFHRNPLGTSAILGPVTPDNIINIGKDLWQVVLAGEPVVNLQTDFANALPQGVNSWEDLENWQTPMSKVYQVTFQNFYGKTVVDFSYRLIFTYGGNFKGKGKYLSHVTIVPANLNVSWGYTFSVQAQVPNVTNAGTSADPVGAAELLVTWKLQNFMRNSVGSASYYVKGDGTFVNVSGTADPAPAAPVAANSSTTSAPDAATSDTTDPFPSEE